MTVEEKNFQPIYLQLKDTIIDYINSGKFQINSCLPSERNLEKTFNVSRVSVRKALDELLEAGIIEKRPSKRAVIKKSGMPEVKNMAFVSIFSQDSNADIYRIFHEILLCKCNSAGINLYYVNANQKLPAFLYKVFFDTIFISGQLNHIDSFKELIRPGTKLVALDNVFDSTKFTTVCTDNFNGGELAARHLIAGGCKKLLYLGVESAYIYRPFRERRRGFISTVQEQGVEYNVLEIERDMPKYVALGLTKYFPDKGFDGIFAFNDHLAINALTFLLKLGVKIPEDVAIIGFDGSSMGAYTIPSLTSIAQPAKEIIEKAFKLAVSGKTGDKKLYNIPGKLIHRSSTV